MAVQNDEVERPGFKNENVLISRSYELLLLYIEYSLKSFILLKDETLKKYVFSLKI